MMKLAHVRICENNDIKGYICDRAEGHDGKHIAFDHGGIVICEWYSPDITGQIAIEFLNHKVTNDKESV